MPVSSASFQSRIEKLDPHYAQARYGAAPAPKSIFTVSIVAGVLGYLGFCLMEYHVLETLRIGFADIKALAMVFGGTMVLAWALRMALKIEGKGALKGQALGAIAAACTLHMGVHALPQAFEMGFSPSWVQTVTSQTDNRLTSPEGGYATAKMVLVDEWQVLTGDWGEEKVALLLAALE
ncbi:MAG: hypothetical protein AAGD04_01670 [Pseudomonadota bacterium]